jgi:hypothetical protein
MEQNEILKLLSDYCGEANSENIESIMQHVDKILVSMPEKQYYENQSEIDDYVNELNKVYLERMKELGRVKTIYLSDLFGPSPN